MKRTLVIHPDDPTTDFLERVYRGTDVTLVREPASMKKSKLRDLILAHDRTIGLGHGSPGGLFAYPYEDIVEGHDAYALNGIYNDILTYQEENVYIWCNADQWVVNSEAPIFGIFTGMFISEMMEAELFGVKTTEKELEESNNFFADLLGQALREGMNKLETHCLIAQNYGSLRSEVAQFNMRRLYVR